MFIPVTIDYSLTLTGECRKAFVCEMCEREFSYIHQRTVQVRQSFFSLSYSVKAVTAELRAKGEKKLAAVLQNEFDIEPCPGCGWVQQSMIDFRKKCAFRGMKTLALLSLLIGLAIGITFAVVGFINHVDDDGYYYFAVVTANIGISCALAFWGFRWLILRLTDPNRNYGHIDSADSESANDEVEPQQ